MRQRRLHVCDSFLINCFIIIIKIKTFQYLMGYSDIKVTLNTYTHLGLENAADELKRMEELADARRSWRKNVL